MNWIEPIQVGPQVDLSAAHFMEDILGARGKKKLTETILLGHSVHLGKGTQI